MRRRRTGIWMAALSACLLAAPGPARPAAQAVRPPIVVGSKPFAESYLLAEVFAQLLEAHGIAVTRRPGLGATEVAFPALVSGAIDVFPEYSGTGLLVILKAPREGDRLAVFDRVSREMARRFDVRWLPPLGFENTYAMSVRTETAGVSACAR